MRLNIIIIFINFIIEKAIQQSNMNQHQSERTAPLQTSARIRSLPLKATVSATGKRVRLKLRQDQKQPVVRTAQHGEPMHIQDQGNPTASAGSYGAGSLGQMASVPHLPRANNQFYDSADDSIMSSQASAMNRTTTPDRGHIQVLQSASLPSLGPEDVDAKVDNEACLNIQDSFSLEGASTEDAVGQLGQRPEAAKSKIKFKKKALEQAKRELAQPGGETRAPDAYFEQRIARKTLENKMVRKEQKVQEAQEEEARRREMRRAGTLREPQGATSATGTQGLGLLANQHTYQRSQTLETSNRQQIEQMQTSAGGQKDPALGEPQKKGAAGVLGGQTRLQSLHDPEAAKDLERRTQSPREQLYRQSISVAVMEHTRRPHHLPSRSAAMAAHASLPYHGLENESHAPAEDQEFLDHFTIEDMLTRTCLLVRSNKLSGRHYVLKQLQPHLLKLADWSKERLEFTAAANPERLLNTPYRPIELNIVDSWAKMPPQSPLQNFNGCYGIVQIKQQIYTLCDFVEDDQLLPFHQSDEDERQEDWQPKQRLRKAAAAHGPTSTLTPRQPSKNVFDLIKSMEMDHVHGSQKVPEAHQWAVLDYLVQTSRALAHAHSHDVVHGSFGLSKVLVQRRALNPDRRDEPADAAIRAELLPQNHVLRDQKGTNRYELKKSLEAVQDEVRYFALDEAAKHNFIIINFEPWAVEQLMKQYEKDEPAFLGALRTERLSLDRSHFLKIAKLLDLEAYGRSVLDMLVGKSAEGAQYRRPGAPGAAQEDDEADQDSDSCRHTSSSKRRAAGGSMPVDQIPLKWSHSPLINGLLEVLHLCFGPHEANNSIAGVDTVAIFRRIHRIASHRLQELLQKSQHYDSLVKLPLKQMQLNLAWTADELDRRRSAMLNNSAVMLFFGISESAPASRRQKTLRRMHDSFTQALQICPQNAVVRLNKALLEWSLGALRDDEVGRFLQDTLYKLDPEAAILFHLLYAGQIAGEKVEPLDMRPFVSSAVANPSRLSNLAQYLLADPLVQAAKDEILNEAAVVEGTEAKQSRPQASKKMERNQRLALGGAGFKAEKIFFSNNERFVGVVGEKEIIAFDARNGKEIYRRNLPKGDEKPVDLEVWAGSTVSDEVLPPEGLKHNARRGTATPQMSQHQPMTTQQLLDLRDQSNENPQIPMDDATGVFRDGTHQSLAEQSEMAATHYQEPGAASRLGSRLTESQQGISPSRPLLAYASTQDTAGLGYQSSLNANSKLTMLGAQAEEEASFAHDSVQSTLPDVHALNQQSSEDLLAAATLRRGDTQQSLLQNDQEQVKHHQVGADPDASRPVGTASNQRQSRPRVDFKQDEDRRVRLRGNTPGPTDKAATQAETRRVANQDKQQTVQPQPRCWVTSISNDGKRIALFDKEQQVRNRSYTSEEHKAERLYIYDLTMQVQAPPAGQPDPGLTCLDLHKLLDDEEVLNFGFDDTSSSSATAISVQAKDLQLYVVDHASLRIWKVGRGQYPLFMRSIFYNANLRKRCHSVSPDLKEFVEAQEHMGNIVLLPKVNDRVVAVKAGEDDLVTIYSVDGLEVVRRLALHESDSGFSADAADSDVHGRGDAAKTSIDVVEIGPEGRIIAAIVDGALLLRVVNSLARLEPLHKDGHEGRKMWSFLPIYQDFDYNRPGVSEPTGGRATTEMAGQRKGAVQAFPVAGYEPRQTLELPGTEERTQQSIATLKDMNMADAAEKLCPSTLERSCQLFHTARATPPHQIVKHDKLVELLEVVQLLGRWPSLLLECDIPPEQRNERLRATFELLRSFGTLSKRQISTVGFLGVKRLCLFDQFRLPRSSERISAISCGSVVGQASPWYLAALVGRTLQVCELPRGKVLFQKKMPNAVQHCALSALSSRPQPFAFLDNDQLLLYQEGASTLVFISIGSEIETHAQLQRKQISQDVTINVEKPLSEYIKNANDFRIAADATGMGHDDEGLSEGGADAAGHDHHRTKARKNLEFKWKIEAVFTTDSTAPYAHVAVLGKMRLAVFDVQEDLASTADVSTVIDKDYRADRVLRAMGQITAVAFENKRCGGLVTCSRLGWLCLWHLGRREIIHKVQISAEPKLRDCSLMRYLDASGHLFCYFPQAPELLHIGLPANEENDDAAGADAESVQPAPRMREDKKLLIKSQSKVLAKELREELGMIRRLQEDRQQKLLFILTSKQYLCVYDLAQACLTQKLGPYPAIQMVLDDNCTCLVALDESGKEAVVHMLEWEHALHQVANPYAWKFAEKRTSRKSTGVTGTGSQAGERRKSPTSETQIVEQKSKACTIF